MTVSEIGPRIEPSVELTIEDTVEPTKICHIRAMVAMNLT
jgi:hypothetical protein